MIKLNIIIPLALLYVIFGFFNATKIPVIRKHTIPTINNIKSNVFKINPLHFYKFSFLLLKTNL